MRRVVMVTLLIFSIIASVGTGVCASAYPSYTYEKQTARALKSPAAMVPETVITAQDFGVGKMNDPADVFSDSNGRVYILDSGNSRIICFDASFKKILFLISGTDISNDPGFSFKGAQGIFVNDTDIYIADTNNGRIIRCPLPDESFRMTGKSEIITPKDLLWDTSKTPFRPGKIVADRMGRMFVVANGVFEGLLEISAEGDFLSYVGANKVSMSALDYFRRMFATRKQWEAMAKQIPVEFSNVFIDSDEFIYTTAKGQTGEVGIRRLNLNGANILRIKPEQFFGDHFGYTAELNRTEEPFFIDVAAGPDETFAGLDKTSGRVFVYDSDCNLMFQFGGNGGAEGTFLSPNSLVWLPDNRIGVLDIRNADFTVFRTTDYGDLILSAVESEFKGEYESAAESYKQILVMNANSELPYIGFGKQLYRQGMYKEAMPYFKLGNDREYYSRAYEKHRKELMSTFIPIVIALILLIVLIAGVFSLVKGIQKARLKIDGIRKIYGGHD